MYVDVLIEHTFLGNQTLTYITQDAIEVGVRVRVPLGSQEIVGFVVAVHEHVETDRTLKEVVEVIDVKPIINQELDALAKWMAWHTVSPLIRCYQAILPNKLTPKSSHEAIKTQRFVVPIKGEERVGLTPKQIEFLGELDKAEILSLKEATAAYSGYKKLAEMGYVDIITQEVRYQENAVVASQRNYPLTPQQESVLEAIDLTSSKTYLLHGVTGSGKTEVYLSLASEVLAQNKQVLILVPEISLTPQMIERVSKRFGQDVAIYHSALNNQEKYEQYKRIQEGTVNIVVGTRSSVFLPFHRLGLIVMDEEHDSSYKQESVPFYHTRDVAMHRATYHGCPVILGSASPSLESYARALKGVYTLLELKGRVNDAFPIVEVIDTNQALYNKDSSYLTKDLVQALQDNLNVGKQSVLLLNRRGYMTLLKDAHDNVLQCDHCDVALNYHKDDGLIHCHMCGSASRIPRGMKVAGSGVGTQRLEEAILKLFPAARVIRMDADATRKKNSHEVLLKQFMNHEADILIGTQMIAKGLDNENVTLVGIVNADAGLLHTDFRSVESSFQTILQASGRAGRGQYMGKVLIQTANPHHYAIQCAIHHKYQHFFKQEMQYRKLAMYPPYTYLISITVSDEDMDKMQTSAQRIAQFLNSPNVQTLGPTPLRKLARKHRARIILKGRDLDSMIELCHAAMHMTQSSHRTGVNVDVNPLTIE